jgi:O-antigen ligase
LKSVHFGWLCVILSGVGAILAESLSVWMVLLLLGSGLASIPLLRAPRTVPQRIPLYWPVLIFGGCVLPLSTLASADIEGTTWPILAIWLWSLTLLLAIVSWSQGATNDAKLALTTGVFIVGGTALALVTFLLIRPANKFTQLTSILQRIADTLWSNGVSLEGSFHSNVIAGLVMLLAPLAIALAIGAWREKSETFITLPLLTLHPRISRLLLSTISLLLLAILVLTQSRSGWLGAAAGITVITWCLLRPRGRIVAITLGIAAVAVGWLWRNQAGQNVFALVMSSVKAWRYTPSGIRLTLWERSVQAALDYPLTGIGLGMFSTMLQKVYPWSPANKLDAVNDVRPPHAHNLVLQSAVELGSIGMLLLLIVLIVTTACAIVLLRRSPRHSAVWYWCVGILATLTAYVVFNFTDAALATKTVFVFWGFVGLVMVGWLMLADEASQERMRRVTAWGTGFALGMLLLVVGVSGSGQRNLQATKAFKGLVAGRVSADLLTTTSRDCRSHYFTGLVAQAAGEVETRDAAWRALIDCTPIYIPTLSFQLPRYVPLAELAYQSYPSRPDAIFWLARAVGTDDITRSTSLYQAGLVLDSADARSWGELGQLLIGINDDAALMALSNSCFEGDPPESGCRAAGDLALALDDVSAANVFYEQATRGSAQSSSTTKATNENK